MRALDYFLVPERVTALRAACEDWMYTPFRERSRVKGPLGGVDCVNLIAALFLQIGAIDAEIAVPPYDVDHALRETQSILRDWFERDSVRSRVRRVDEDEAHLDGDMVFPKIGLTEHHLSLRIGPALIHSARKAGGVCRMPAADFTFSPSRYRLMEVSQ